MSGVDVAVLAAFLEVSPATLRSTIRRHGIRPLRRGVYDPHEVARHRRYGEPDCAECELLAVPRGRRVADMETLAALLGVSVPALRQTVRRHGVKPLRRGVYDVEEMVRHRRHAAEGCARCHILPTLDRGDRTP